MERAKEIASIKVPVFIELSPPIARARTRDRIFSEILADAWIM